MITFVDVGDTPVDSDAQLIVDHFILRRTEHLSAYVFSIGEDGGNPDRVALGKLVIEEIRPRGAASPSNKQIDVIVKVTDCRPGLSDGRHRLTFELHQPDEAVDGMGAAEHFVHYVQ